MAEGSIATMWARTGRLYELAKTVVTISIDREVTFLAAAVSYYAFVSLIPMVLLGLAVTSFLGGGIEAITAPMAGVLTPATQDVLAVALAADAGRGPVTVVGIVILTWSSLRLFRGLDRAFSLVYGSRPGSILHQLQDGLIVLVAGVVGAAAVAGLSAIVSILQFGPLAGAISLGLVWLMLLVAFLPLYVVFPDVGVTVRQGLPGAALSATTVVALGSLLGYYVSIAGSFALYGLLGAVLLVLTWLYIGSNAILVGAVLNAVIAGQLGDYREIGTDSDAVAE